jgi:hypothetical protein
MGVRCKLEFIHRIITPPAYYHVILH